MKKYLIMLFLAATVPGAFAQDYYVGKKRITADGITFEVNAEPGCMAYGLDNVLNVKSEDPNLYYQDGSVVTEEHPPRRCEIIEGTPEQAFVETFTKEEYQRMRNSGWKQSVIVVSFTIDPDGNTIEVGFTLRSIPEVVSLPPEKFALFEKNLKRIVKWKVTEFGKKLKYMFGIGFFNLNNREYSYPTEPSEPPADHPAGGTGNTGGGN